MQQRPLVEAVSGRSFEAFTQSELLGPLQMSESSWFLAPLDTGNVAVPCTWTGESYEAHPHLGMAFYPAGQLRTSARHLANFARLHLNRGKFEGQRLLRRGTVAEMMRVQDPEAAPARGLGFIVCPIVSCARWRESETGSFGKRSESRAGSGGGVGIRFSAVRGLRLRSGLSVAPGELWFEVRPRRRRQNSSRRIRGRAPVERSAA